MTAAPAAADTAARQGGARVGVQKFGTFLSGMVMPNIPAFIAWGLITALFIKTGWLPVPVLGGFGETIVDGEAVANVGLVGPMITYMLPLLIAYQGGKMIYDTRGGVVASIATMGVIVGAGIPMFIGAMIMGPLAAWIMKQLDKLWHGKIKAGFEMLVNNFSAGIVAMLLALVGFYAIAPAVKWLTTALANGVEFLVDNNLLPVASILIEPAKILFLNNAINHGVFTPLGTQDVLEHGKSLLFLMEANPGPGIGILTAFMVFGIGMARASAPGALIIHALGGIHEIYFPYVLSKPALILAAIGGGATGVLTNMLLGTGLVAPASPGSLIAIMIMAAPGTHLGIGLSVVLSAAVSFLIAALILRASRKKDLANENAGDLSAAIAATEANKGKASAALSGLGAAAGAAAGGDLAAQIAARDVRKVIFACDAGMGSSAMGASVLRTKFKKAGLGDIDVTNVAIANLDQTPDLIVTHQDLTPRAKQQSPNAIHVSVNDFMSSPKYDEVVALVKEAREGGSASAEQAEQVPAGAGAGPAAGAPAAAAAAVPAAASAAVASDAVEASGEEPILTLDRIRATGTASSQDEAIQEAADLLVAAGAVDASYAQAMRDREASISTYMGNFLAIPHGTNEAKGSIHASALSFVRYAQPLDWGGEEVRFVVGIAGKDGGHLAILQKIAIIFSDESQVQHLLDATDEDALFRILEEVNAA